MSILDKLPESRTDVRDAVSPAVDISGPGYVLNPSRFKYVLIIPMWDIEIRLSNHSDIEYYVHELNLLFMAFTPDYQILLRHHIYHNIKYDSKYFPELSTEDRRAFNDKLSFTLTEDDYVGGIFIQFNTPDIWTYKKQYRFLSSLMNLICRYENIIGQKGKSIFLYRRYDEQPEEVSFWDIIIISTRMYRLKDFTNLENISNTDLIVKKCTTQLKYLTAMTRFFNEPDKRHTPDEISQYRTHIYNRHFKHTHHSIRVNTYTRMKLSPLAPYAT